MTRDFEQRARQRAKKSLRTGKGVADREPSGVPALEDAAEQAQRAVDDVVSKGPSGAMAVAGTAVAIVVALWVAFYFLVFLPRG